MLPLLLLLQLLLLLALDLLPHQLLALRLLSLLLLELLLHQKLLLLQGLALTLGFGLMLHLLLHLLLHLQLLLGLLLELALGLLLLLALLGLAPLPFGLGAGRVVRNRGDLLVDAGTAQGLCGGFGAGLKGGRRAHVGASFTIATLPGQRGVRAGAAGLGNGRPLRHKLHLWAWQGLG